jgi:hypothetical protein
MLCFAASPMLLLVAMSELPQGTMVFVFKPV